MTTPASSASPDAGPDRSAPRKCPICGRPRHADHTPFCSTRCRDRDLLRWLDEGYAIPGPPADVPNDNDPGR